MQTDQAGSLEQARIDLARGVSGDLEAIFAGAALPASGGGGGGRVRTFADMRRGGGLRAASVGALVAAGLAGLAAGAAMSPKGELTAPAAPQKTMQVVTNEPLGPSANYLGYPWSPEPYGRMDVGIPTQAAQPAPAATAVQKAVHTPKARPPAAKDVCGRRCSHDEVMQADIRLRRAYFRAIDAGVSRPALASYRSRWTSLRRHARREPERMVAGYGALTRDLTRAASRARRS